MQRHGRSPTGCACNKSKMSEQFFQILGSREVTTPFCFLRGWDMAVLAGFLLPATAGSCGPRDLEPTAIAIIPAKNIAPTIAFALSHRLNVRRSSADSLL